jgi:hypothetical protein
MNFFISSHLENLLQGNKFKKERWKIQFPNAGLNIFVRKKETLFEVTPIEIQGDLKNLKALSDKFFKNLQKTLNRLKKIGIKPSALVFHGGGSIQMPQFFKDFCVKNSIEYFIYSKEDDGGLSDYFKFYNLRKKLPEFEGIL